MTSTLYRLFRIIPKYSRSLPLFLRYISHRLFPADRLQLPSRAFTSHRRISLVRLLFHEFGSPANCFESSNSRLLCLVKSHLISTPEKVRFFLFLSTLVIESLSDFCSLFHRLDIFVHCKALLSPVATISQAYRDVSKRSLQRWAPRPVYTWIGSRFTRFLRSTIYLGFRPRQDSWDLPQVRYTLSSRVL